MCADEGGETEVVPTTQTTLTSSAGSVATATVTPTSIPGGDEAPAVKKQAPAQGDGEGGDVPAVPSDGDTGKEADKRPTDGSIEQLQQRQTESREKGVQEAHSTYMGTLTFEEGVELPRPSSLLTQERTEPSSSAAPDGGISTLASVATSVFTAGQATETDSRVPLTRTIEWLSIMMLAVILGSAFYLSSISSMRYSTFVLY